jgi:hypothetical protein
VSYVHPRRDVHFEAARVPDEFPSSGYLIVSTRHVSNTNYAGKPTVIKQTQTLAIQFLERDSAGR